MKTQGNRNIKIMIVLFFTSLLLLTGLNYRQLYSAWAIWIEMKRLASLAENEPEEYQNPASLEDRFEERLSPDFWEFTTINGGGVVSAEGWFRMRQPGIQLHFQPIRD